MVVQPEELPALLAAFATLFCMFSSYTILRPIRDTMGITSGVEKLPYLFWGTFAAMLALQPVYGWLTSRLRSPRVPALRWVYAFFIANLLAFYVWFNLQQDQTWIARIYYIWVSVFNFFIVAVFWSLMADVFTREQAGRMFGFIAAGGSTGGGVGAVVAGRLALPLGSDQPVADLGVAACWFAVLHEASNPLASAIRHRRTRHRDRRSFGRQHSGCVLPGHPLALSPGHRAVRDSAVMGDDLPVSRAAGLRGQGLRDQR